jgi:hypothetical protein
MGEIHHTLHVDSLLILGQLGYKLYENFKFQKLQRMRLMK